MQDETFDRAARTYVEAHFATPDAMAAAAGCAPGRIAEMVAAGIAPGAVYARDPDRGWWSALAGWVDGGEGTPDDGAETWLSPWAAWAFRQARLAGRSGETLDQIARRTAEAFQNDFIVALAAVGPAPLAFPDCFDADGRVDPVSAGARAAVEWRSWLRGGYAVCLRVFTAETCVRKEAFGALLKRHAADPDLWPMAADEATAACATLAGLMLPFAPWERPVGTPGKTIDTLLARHDLGREAPYG